MTEGAHVYLKPHMFVYMFYAHASCAFFCVSVLEDRDTAPQTRAYPPATWRPPQTRPPETADKAPLGLPANSHPNTHTFLVAPSLLMYPFPVCPSSVPLLPLSSPLSQPVCLPESCVSLFSLYPPISILLLWL